MNVCIINVGVIRKSCTAVLGKLFDMRFSYKHCNFSHVCLLVKMASKTVTRSIDKPTRLYGSSATLIDNIFTNNLTNNISSGNIVTDTTDHFSQVCIVNVNKQKLPHTKKTKFRDYSSIDVNKFMNDLSAINWEEVSGGRNIKYIEIS